jgi:hypothetical protein
LFSGWDGCFEFFLEFHVTASRFCRLKTRQRAINKVKQGVWLPFFANWPVSFDCESALRFTGFENNEHEAHESSGRNDENGGQCFLPAAFGHLSGWLRDK